MSSSIAVWVIVVALTEQQEVVLVRQFRPGLGRTILELAGRDHGR